GSIGLAVQQSPLDVLLSAELAGSARTYGKGSDAKASVQRQRLRACSSRRMSRGGQRAYWTFSSVASPFDLFNRFLISLALDSSARLSDRSNSSRSCSTLASNAASPSANFAKLSTAHALTNVCRSLAYSVRIETTFSRSLAVHLSSGNARAICKRISHDSCCASGPMNRAR